MTQPDKEHPSVGILKLVALEVNFVEQTVRIMTDQNLLRTRRDAIPPVKVTGKWSNPVRKERICRQLCLFRLTERGCLSRARRKGR